MYRVTIARTVALVAVIALGLGALAPSAHAKCPTSGSPDRSVCKYWSALLTPGLIGLAYVPAGEGALGPWYGGAVRLSLYTWSDNAVAFGPSQGKFFLDFGLLRSGEDDTNSMSVFRSGFHLSFEGNASRSWLIPYYGGSMGRVAEETLEVNWFAEAVLGVHALYTQNLRVDVEGGYALPFSEVDVMRGAMFQIAASFTLW
ncbi:MAG TPA: hypothetical protein VNM90_24180 [Haliangium sp.]|nr:hypothetical protein [Haliangium sp.]